MALTSVVSLLVALLRAASVRGALRGGADAAGDADSAARQLQSSDVAQRIFPARTSARYVLLGRAGQTCSAAGLQDITTCDECRQAFSEIDELLGTSEEEFVASSQTASGCICQTPELTGLPETQYVCKRSEYALLPSAAVSCQSYGYADITTFDDCRQAFSEIEVLSDTTEEEFVASSQTASGCIRDTRNGRRVFNGIVFQVPRFLNQMVGLPETQYVCKRPRSYVLIRDSGFGCVANGPGLEDVMSPQQCREAVDQLVLVGNLQGIRAEVDEFSEDQDASSVPVLSSDIVAGGCLIDLATFVDDPDNVGVPQPTGEDVFVLFNSDFNNPWAQVIQGQWICAVF